MSPKQGYRILGRLGSGTNGEVFRALAPGGVEVAIKRLRHPLDDKGARRELQALELIRSLRHPFLLQTHAYQVEDDRLNIVMELAEGSLLDRFEERRRAGLPGISADELLCYEAEAAEALDYLHANGVLHRNIKPSNILLLNGHAKVADFGLAPGLAAAQSSALPLGTPLYMAPEVWRGEVGVHSDQYSLAAVFAEMARGKRIYGGGNSQQLFEQHLGGAPDLAGFPEKVQTVLRRALAKDPNSRYSTCTEFIRALSEAQLPAGTGRVC
jgi:serine/threonine protein kinase